MLLLLKSMQVWNSLRQTRCFHAEHLTVLQHQVQTALICNSNPSVFLGNGHSIEPLQSSLQPGSGPQPAGPAHVWNVHYHARTLMHAHSQAWPRHSLSQSHRDRRSVSQCGLVPMHWEGSVCEYVCASVCECAVSALPVRWTLARLLDQHTCVLTAETHIVLPVSFQDCHCTKAQSWCVCHTVIIIKWLS